MRFLRPRMRNEIFPLLRQTFGKGFEKNLCSIAKEAEKLKYYLDEMVQKYGYIQSDMGLLFEEIPDMILNLNTL